MHSVTVSSTTDRASVTSGRPSPHGPAARVRERRIRRRRSVVVLVLLLALLGAGLGGWAILHSTGSAGSVLRSVVPYTPTAQDGYITSDISPFDDSAPAIAKLDPALRSAVQDAARAAESDGIPMVVASGWRSHDYQTWLFDQAVESKGEQAARETVAAPGSSAHEQGRAVDIGYTDADSWLMQHGADYGLCQIYANEMWHFELATTPGGECPAQLEGAEASR